MTSTLRSGLSKINDLTTLLSPGQEEHMISDITKASLYQQRSKNVRETWMDKVKRGSNMKQSLNTRVGRGLSNQTPSALYQTMDSSAL